MPLLELLRDGLAHGEIAAAEGDDAEGPVAPAPLLDDRGRHVLLRAALCLRSRRSMTSWYSSGISV
jgi:hypothetical protein